MAETINSRRPRGYHGSVAHILNLLEKDSLGALSDMREIRRRAEDGEYVMAEIEQEAVDALFRAMETARHAGRGFEYMAQVCRILKIDGDVMNERYAAMYANPAHGFRRNWSYEPPAEHHAPSVEEAARFIAKHAGAPRTKPAQILADPKVAKSAYRRASKRLHPDLGGDTSMMQRLEEANRILKAELN
jgi:hypothetical protein